MKILFVKVLFISVAQAAGPFAHVGRPTNKMVTSF